MTDTQQQRAAERAPLGVAAIPCTSFFSDVWFFGCSCVAKMIANSKTSLGAGVFEAGCERRQGLAVPSPFRRVVLHWPIALVGQFFLVFAILGLSGPGRIDIVDGQTRYEGARSLVEHGDSVIRDKCIWFAVLPGRDGQPHTNYRFPHSGFGVLAIWLANATGPGDEARRQFFFTFIGAAAGALLALTYSLWFRVLGFSAIASIGWGTAGIFSTPNWFYATSTFDDLLAAAAGVGAVTMAYWGRGAKPQAALAGLLLGLAFNLKQPMGLFVFPVLAACYHPSRSLLRQLIPIGLVLAGLGLGVAGQVAYDRYKFPPETCDPAQAAEALYGAVWTSDPLPALAGLAFSPSAGAIWYCPTLLLSIAGWMWWRRKDRLFCDAALLTSVVFTVFLSFLVFFKGEPCWGPRYLTPVFALLWLFVPFALRTSYFALGTWLLALGFTVQLLGLSVDPQRLFLRDGLPFNYYVADRWLGFNPAVSHLWQRPREIVEIWLIDGRAPEYSPSSIPTYAATLPSGYPVVVASTVGLFAPLPAPSPLGALAALPMRIPVHAMAHAQAAARQYHIYNSFRPWWISQQYLTPEQRPVALMSTLLFIGALGAAGVSLLVVGLRPRLQS